MTVKLIDLDMRCSGSYPVIKLVRSIGVEREIHADRRIDRTFSDRSVREFSVLGIAPSALIITKRFTSGGERIKCGLGID